MMDAKKRNRPDNLEFCIALPVVVTIVAWLLASILF